MHLKGKKIVVVGLARTGVAVAKFASERGAIVTVTDMKTKSELHEAVKQLVPYRKIKYELGRHQIKTFLASDLIVVSPGVPLNIEPLVEAKNKNKEIISELEFACRFIRIPMIAITGTNGKTTTTLMTGQMFKNAGKNAFVGGNVGNALTNLLLSRESYQYVVCEVSSFQLETIKKFKPNVAIILNLTADHLDRHGTMESYKAFKGRIFENQTSADYLILNADDPLLAGYASLAKSRVLYFKKCAPSQSPEGICYEEPYFYLGSKYTGKRQFRTDKIQILGAHNKENFMAAILAAKIFKCSDEAIQRTLDTFEGVPHRLEYVKTCGYVDFYNDSKATNVDSVIRSLESFQKPLILILGGRDKGGNFEVLRPLIQKKVKILILMGEAKEKINRAIGDYTETFVVGTLEEAVFMSYQKSRRGDVILFSPGCASFDEFKNYEDRGNRFKGLLRDL